MDKESEESYRVTVTREGWAAYRVAVQGPGMLALSAYTLTRRGAFRRGRRIAREAHRDRVGRPTWTFTARFTVGPGAGR